MQKTWALRAAALALGAGAAIGLAAGPAGAATSTVVAKLGDTGRAVTCVQQGLNLENAANLTVDGTFGQTTYTAVINYQAKHRLPQTGVVDHDTGFNIYGSVFWAVQFRIPGDYAARQTWLDQCARVVSA
ncbi:peptidoglycan-binding protein [Kitasatospora sp. A2-31]|uniref:peptidoglycan-binding domain-containing protein n=1 Tax=Kitasatospora sp. A2-31 TaxID=2916414 RepID=UPI001EEF32AC|nr:peptidoglycan-binding domain-containing protein [Kitasatospora sp. A2-31]MCG6498827.1 peptidoglycan-binding protein [Kitasatospora sp. A2-31]